MIGDPNTHYHDAANGMMHSKTFGFIRDDGRVYVAWLDLEVNKMVVIQPDKYMQYLTLMKSFPKSVKVKTKFVHVVQLIFVQKLQVKHLSNTEM